jgi:hypothetical protein
VSDQDDLHEYLRALSKLGPPNDIVADIEVMRAYLAAFKELGRPHELKEDIALVKEMRRGAENRRWLVSLTKTTAVYFSSIMLAWLLFRDNILEWFRGGSK